MRYASIAVLAITLAMIFRDHPTARVADAAPAIQQRTPMELVEALQATPLNPVLLPAGLAVWTTRPADEREVAILHVVGSVAWLVARQDTLTDTPDGRAPRPDALNEAANLRFLVYPTEGEAANGLNMHTFNGSPSWLLDFPHRCATLQGTINTATCGTRVGRIAVISFSSIRGVEPGTGPLPMLERATALLRAGLAHAGTFESTIDPAIFPAAGPSPRPALASPVPAPAATPEPGEEPE